MQPKEYGDVVRRETFDLAKAATGRMDAPIPSCPGWSMSDLVHHLSEVQRFWQDVVAGRRQRRQDVSPLARPDDADPIEWLTDGAVVLAAALEAAEPDEPVWTWMPDRTVGVVQRRQALEAAVHRWDAQAGAGSVQPIEPEVAADGLDEFFEVIIPSAEPTLTGSGETIAVVASDAGTPWGVRMGTGGPRTRRGAAAGDVVLSGSASDLLLVLWGRLPSDAIRIDGDESAYQRFHDAVDLG